MLYQAYMTPVRLRRKQCGFRKAGCGKMQMNLTFMCKEVDRLLPASLTLRTRLKKTLSRAHTLLPD